jgi:glycosyltransferase involved in cell wall biosynthesis
MPRVSIAVPAYNSERYIAQSIESLLAQSFGDFELIISDNASTDGTADICRRYAALDSRVRYVRRQENIGGPGNFRYVWSLCSGEYHKWSTADDYWAPEFLAQSVAVLDTQPDVVLCYPKTRLIDSAGAPIRDYEDTLHLVATSPRQRFNDLLRLIGLCNAHLGLIRRAAMARTGLIGSERNSDTHFLAELTLYGKFWLLPEILFFRRFHEESSSWNRSDAERQRAYYDPGRMQPRAMHTVRKYRRLFGAVMRAPVGSRQRIGLVSDLCRYARWERQALAREIYSRVAGRGKD